MSKRHVNQKKQKTLLNYFSSPSTFQKVSDDQKVIESTHHVANSMSVMSIDNDEQQQDPVSEQKESEKEEEIVNTRNRKKNKRKRVIESTSNSSNNSESDVPFSVRLSQLKQQKEGLKQQKEQVQCDSDDNNIHDEELHFLDKSDILQDRTRGKKVSRYSEALKKLADRKSKLDTYQGESGPIEKYTVNSSSNSDSSSDSSEEEKDMAELLRDNDEDLEGFVVDDDMIDGEKNDVAVTTTVEMPAEFTKTRTLSFSKQVENYIEYLVAICIQPHLNIESNGRYKIAKNAVVRRVQSYKDSIVTSDVWLSSFKEAVDEYSNWTTLKDNDQLSSLYLCQACRSNKPSSRKIRLDSEDKPTATVMYLGSECYRKALLYHQLYHFELHMYKKVKKQVKMINNNSSNDNNLQQQQQISATYYMLKDLGKVKQLKKKAVNLFNTIIAIYNLRNQRSGLAQDTTSSSSSSSYYSSSEDL